MHSWKSHTLLILFLFFVPGSQVDQTSPALLYLVYSKTPLKEDSADLKTEDLGLGAKERTWITSFIAGFKNPAAFSSQAKTKGRLSEVKKYAG